MHDIALVNGHIGLLCFASLNALEPRVLNFCASSSPSAGSEPRTTASAATNFSGFLDGGTVEANGAEGRRSS